MSADLATRVGAVELEHPVMNASGTLDPLAARAAGLAVDRELAVVVTKTVTPLAREGNEAPRVCEVTGGMLNSIGLPNPGLDEFAASVLPAVRALGRPLVVSIGGFEHGDYELACRRLDAEPGIAALELNVSCPNVKSGCISIGSDPAETEAVVRLCRAATSLPLWVKLSPNVADLAAVARAAERGGADALVLTNTLRALALDRVHAAPAARRDHRRPLGTGAQAGRAGGGSHLPRGLRPAHRRRRRHRERLGRARVHRRRGERGAGRQRRLPRAAARAPREGRACHPTRRARPRDDFGARSAGKTTTLDLRFTFFPLPSGFSAPNRLRHPS